MTRPQSLQLKIEYPWLGANALILVFYLTVTCFRIDKLSRVFPEPRTTVERGSSVMVMGSFFVISGVLAIVTGLIAPILFYVFDCLRAESLEDARSSLSKGL